MGDLNSTKLAKAHETLLVAFAAPYRVALALASLLMLFETAVTPAVPWLGGRFASALLSPGGGRALLLTGLLAAVAAQSALRFVSGYMLSRVSQKILADLRMRVYDHLQALPLARLPTRPCYAALMSVWLKSLPLNKSGSPVALARA
jgi:subfamily B ATP-binding cassette protein MsbA